MKKIIATAATVAMFAAAPAFAATVSNFNSADVSVWTTSSSNTGGNAIIGSSNGVNDGWGGNTGIGTGDSGSSAASFTLVNSNDSNVHDVSGPDASVSNHNNASVYVATGASSDTGHNAIGFSSNGANDGQGGKSTILTGDSGSQAGSITVVNTNLSRVHDVSNFDISDF